MSLPQDTRDKIPEESQLTPEISSDNDAISDSTQTSASHNPFADIPLIPSTAVSSNPEPSKENVESSILPPPYSPSAEANTSLDIPMEVTRMSSDDTKIYIGDEFKFSLDSIPRNYDSTTQRLSLQNYTSDAVTTQPLPIQYPSITSVNLQGHQRGTSSSSRDLLRPDMVPLKLCKICQEPEQHELFETSHDNADSNFQLSNAKGRLISPCRCKGSLQYVHLGCLNEWRATTVRQDVSYQCEVCKYEYKFYRPRLAKIVGSGLFHHAMTFTIFLLVIYVISWIIQVIDIHLINKHRPPPDHTNHTGPGAWMHTNILGLEALHLIIGTSIISFMGVCFLMINACINGYKSTRDDYCYCGGYQCMECYGCYWFGGGCDGGDCGGFALVLLILIVVLIFVTGIFGALIAGYLLIQKVSNTYLDRINEIILEVKKES